MIDVGEEGGDVGREEIGEAIETLRPAAVRPWVPRRGPSELMAALGERGSARDPPDLDLVMRRCPTRMPCANVSTLLDNTACPVDHRDRRPGDDVHAPALYQFEALCSRRRARQERVVLRERSRHDAAFVGRRPAVVVAGCRAVGVDAPASSLAVGRARRGDRALRAGVCRRPRGGTGVLLRSPRTMRANDALSPAAYLAIVNVSCGKTVERAHFAVHDAAVSGLILGTSCRRSL